MYCFHCSIIYFSDCPSTEDPKISTHIPFGICRRSDFIPLHRCDKFINCTTAIPKLKKCAKGLHFNPTSRVCDWPYKAGCGKLILWLIYIEIFTLQWSRYYHKACRFLLMFTSVNYNKEIELSIEWNFEMAYIELILYWKLKCIQTIGM